jgi:transcriptional regulator with XRE-family HTH domain
MTFKELRLRAGLSQRQLAEPAGLDHKTVHWIEVGKSRNPRYGTVKALAKVLGKRPEYVARVIARGVPPTKVTVHLDGKRLAEAVFGLDKCLN